jgi:hypothetical protein
MAILKNTSFRDSNNVLTIPSGTTAQRPLRPPNGAMRYNTSFGVTEVYMNNGWHDISNGQRLTDVWPTSIDSGGMFVELWGAGGGGGRPGGIAFGSEGGAGGYSWGWINTEVVPAGSTLILQVAGGGQLGGTTPAFPGGGTVIGTSDNRYGSAGGGYTGLFLTTVTQANAILIAGGGGGGGSSRANTGNIGGAGGGIEGRDGHSPYDGKEEFRGRGGTQTFAGEANSNGRDRYGITCSNQSDQQGALQGGRMTVNSYGGGGGGGYWGGSAGGYSEPNTLAGAGGGSGFVHPSRILGGGTLAGAYRTPPNPPSGSLGYGGTNSSAGNNGFARITRNGVVTTYSFTGSNVTITL